MILRKAHKSFIGLTNIPTPYRLHFYKALHQELARMEIALETWFMAKTEPGRYWQIDSDDIQFPHIFGQGIHPFIFNRQFHFNPGLIWRLLQRRPDWMFLSGSWYFPTFFISLFLAKLMGCKTILWSESNLKYVEHNHPLANFFRSFIMGMADAYAVPGQWAKEYLCQLVRIPDDKPIIKLPNIVEESKFLQIADQRHLQKKSLRKKWGVPDQPLVVLLTLARLEPIKGLHCMLPALANVNSGEKNLWIIAGEGPQRETLENEIEAYGLGGQVVLVGHQGEQQVFELLTIADAFLLPSLGDPYPLAVIEAMFAGLPVLLSDRVGCSPEALLEGENGYAFDPTDSVGTSEAIERFLKLGQETRRQMGEKSMRIAIERFHTNTVISQLIKDVHAL